jgi:hypothetical protein
LGAKLKAKEGRGEERALAKKKIRVYGDTLILLRIKI